MFKTEAPYAPLGRHTGAAPQRLATKAIKLLIMTESRVIQRVLCENYEKTFKSGATYRFVYADVPHGQWAAHTGTKEHPARTKNYIIYFIASGENVAH